jgi:hypothetical protein
MANILTRALLSADEAIAKASRGSLTEYVPNSPKQYGQPVPATGDANGLITPERMREIVCKTPTAASCMNAILDFAVGVKIDVRNVDPAKKVSPDAARLIRRYIRRPNPSQTQRRFMYALMRDLLTFGYAGVEIERNRAGGVANLHVLDNARIRADYDEHGQVLGYCMLNAAGTPIKGPDGEHGWEPNEVIWFVRDEQSDSLYGVSRIKMLFALGVLESLILNFIGNRFVEGNIPYGVLDLGELSNDELDFAIDAWNEQLQKNGEHRIIFTNSRGGAKWYPFAYGLKELEAKDLLAMIRQQIMGIMGVTMNELGESQDINKSNGYNLSFVFKRRAIEPLLSEVCDTLTERLIHDELSIFDAELYYDEIDSRDELLAAQIDDLCLKVGIVSINAVRNRKGLPSVSGGEEPCVFTGREWIPVSLIGEFATAQLQSLQLVNAQIIQGMMMLAAGGTEGQDGEGDGAQIRPPRVLPPALPGMPAPPGTVGNPGATIKFPQPGAPKGGNGPGGQRPRGIAQAGQNAGIRRDQIGGH